MSSVSAIPASYTDLADKGNPWSGALSTIQSKNTTYISCVTGDVIPEETNTIDVDFSISIPDNATVVGLEFTFRSRHTLNNLSDATLTPIIDGASGTSDLYSMTTGYVDHMVGGPTDLLGLTPTAANINAGVKLRIAIAADPDNTNEQRIDYVDVTVYYTTPDNPQPKWWYWKLTGENNGL